MDGRSPSGDGAVTRHHSGDANEMVGEPGGDVNGAGIELSRLHASPGRPKGARNLHAKHPSSLARRLRHHGVDWTKCLADSIKAFQAGPTSRARVLAREDVRMWLKALPYMVTTTNKVRVRKWKGKASSAATAALDALEGR